MRDKGTINTKQKHHDDGTSFLVSKLSFVGMEKGKTQTAAFEAVNNNNNNNNNNNFTNNNHQIESFFGWYNVKYYK